MGPYSEDIKRLITIYILSMTGKSKIKQGFLKTKKIPEESDCIIWEFVENIILRAYIYFENMKSPTSKIFI